MPPPEPELGGPKALLGARHDLFLKEQVSRARCRCLAVGAGAPRDAAFEWEAVVPEIDERSQLVVAFTSRGQVCEDEPPGSLGASYHGYEKRGPDVVVMVEEAKPGRPRVGGAIVPRPDPDGQLLFEPVPRTLPYGKALTGEVTRCEVELTTRAAAAPVSPAEFPEDEPNEAAAFQGDTLQPDPDAERTDDDEAGRRSGLYLGAIVGPGYSILEPSDADDGKLSGLGVGFDLLLGGSPAQGFAVGALLGATVTGSPTFEQGGQEQTASDVDMNVVSLGAFADYAFVGDLHAMLTVEFERLSFSGREPGLDLADANGFGATLGLGYEFWLARRFSLGVLGRFGYASLDLDSGRANLLAPLLGATLTYH